MESQDCEIKNVCIVYMWKYIYVKKKNLSITPKKIRITLPPPRYGIEPILRNNLIIRSMIRHHIQTLKPRQLSLNKIKPLTIWKYNHYIAICTSFYHITNSLNRLNQVSKLHYQPTHMQFHHITHIIQFYHIFEHFLETPTIKTHPERFE